MFSKQLEEIASSEKFMQEIEGRYIEFISMKEDFSKFDIEFGRQLNFEHQRQPQDCIFDLIKDKQQFLFDEIQEIQRRVKIIQNSSQEKDIIQQMKEQYLKERSQIVESGLTIWDIQKTYQQDITQQLSIENDDFSKILKHFLSRNSSKKMFVWELMDQIILNLGKTVKNRQEDEIFSENFDQQDFLTKQDEQKITFLTQLFKQINQAFDFPGEE